MGRGPGGTKGWLLFPGGRLRLGRAGALHWQNLLFERFGQLDRGRQYFVPSPGGVDGQMQHPHVCGDRGCYSCVLLGCGCQYCYYAGGGRHCHAYQHLVSSQLCI
eukprot:7499498-Alexandrium_andersonii.AAC.1